MVCFCSSSSTFLRFKKFINSFIRGVYPPETMTHFPISPYFRKILKAILPFPQKNSDFHPPKFLTFFSLLFLLFRRLCRRWGSHKTLPDFLFVCFFGRFTSPGSFWIFSPFRSSLT